MISASGIAMLTKAASMDIPTLQIKEEKQVTEEIRSNYNAKFHFLLEAGILLSGLGPVSYAVARASKEEEEPYAEPVYQPEA